MENTANSIEALFERLEAYVRLTLELSKLKLIETVARVSAGLAARLGVILVFSIFMLVLSLGVAFWLGDLMGKVYYGFFAVAGFYLLVTLILHFFMQKWMKRTILRVLIKQFFQ